MGELRCVDGSVLSVAAVACRDRAGKPYEITLNLTRDRQPFGSVGQRCGYQLARLAAAVTAARGDPEQAAQWPDPDDRFPEPAELSGPAAPSAPSRLQPPGEREYFSLRARDRSDLTGSGEFRCTLRVSADWLGTCAGAGSSGQEGSRGGSDGSRSGLDGSRGGQDGRHGQRRPPREHGGAPGLRAWPGGRALAGQHARPVRGSAHGGWRLRRRAVVEVWGAGGIGVRAVLTSAELVAFLDTVLREPDGASRSESAASGAVVNG
ncbi:MAG TPA: hypothetical protein VGI64_17125 [Streptosporangiaceae bacterium]|jgi:hypothetical protein